MDNLVEFILKNIVSHPEDVVVTENTEESSDGRSSQIFTVSVNQEDIGTVIGKNGRTIKSIRNLIKIKGIKESTYIDVKLVENDKEDRE